MQVFLFVFFVAIVKQARFSMLKPGNTRGSPYSRPEGQKAHSQG